METADAPRLPACAFVDAHVHIHPCFPLEPFFDGALGNFRKAARSLDLSATGCLLLTQMAGSPWLREAEEGAWTLVSTGEKDSLVARRSTGESLIVVAGRQIVVHERLEVLALGRYVDIPDGLPLDEALLRVRDSGALPVLPWGFGKWSGRRSALVEATSRPAGRRAVPGGQLQPAPTRRSAPAPARGGGARSLVLPGTDPLPFPDMRAGPARSVSCWRGFSTRSGRPRTCCGGSVPCANNRAPMGEGRPFPGSSGIRPVCNCGR